MFFIYIYAGVESKRPSTKIVHKNMLFYKHYTLNDRTYWRCCKTNSEQRCLARLYTYANGVVEINSHNHN